MTESRDEELVREELRRRHQMILLSSSFESKHDVSRWRDVAIVNYDDVAFGADGSFELSVSTSAVPHPDESPSAQSSADSMSPPPSAVNTPAAAPLARRRSSRARGNVAFSYLTRTLRGSSSTRGDGGGLDAGGLDVGPLGGHTCAPTHDVRHTGYF